MDFIKWSAHAYQLMAEDWNALGYRDACNLDREYTKHWNATAVIAYAIGAKTPFTRPFHFGPEDYTEAARARESDEWHDDFRHIEVDNLGGAFSSFVPRTFTLVDLVNSSCLLYSTNITGSPFPIPTDDPVFRASAFLHEAWHAWKDEHNLKNPPENGGHNFTGGPGGGTPFCATGTGCDFYYPHLKSNYEAGELYKEKGGRGRSHSVFQTQTEFLCDIADNPTRSVPFVSREVAARAANNLMRSSFGNAVPFGCGAPELFSVAIGNPEPPCGTGPNCSVDGDCGDPVRLECAMGCCTDRVK